MNKGFKLLKEFYYYVFIKHVVFERDKKVLIIKNDSIGDFIIFNAFINEVKNSAKFKGYRFDLLTNPRLKTIATEINGDSYDNIISIEPSVFTTFRNFLTFFNKLNKGNYEFVLHPTYSPDWQSQRLVKYVKAKYKIGFDCSLTNMPLGYKKKYDRVYTTLIRTKNDFYHEFERNVEFFSNVLVEEINLSAPKIETKVQTRSEKLILICPGAQHLYRIWPLRNFAVLMMDLNKNFAGYKFMVVTGPGEDNLYAEIQMHCSLSIEQYKIAGFQNLCELFLKSELIICNDSSAAHIAVACSKANVCISNGNHYNRFIPYPKWMNVNQQVVLPKLFENLTEKDLEKYYFGSDIDINTISVEDVFKRCKFYLA